VGIPRYAVGVGAIDGVNLVFTVSTAYVPGSTAVFLNGQLKRADFDDGWTETSPATGTVTLTEAPLLGDVVQIFFIDGATGVLPGEEVTPLKGTLKAADDLLGRLGATAEVTGQTAEAEALNGRMLPTGTISAMVAEVEQLRGTVEIC